MESLLQARVREGVNGAWEVYDPYDGALIAERYSQKEA